MTRQISHLVSLLIKTAFILLLCAAQAFSQDDEAVPARVLDASNRPVGKAELITDINTQVNFTYSIKMWLSDG